MPAGTPGDGVADLYVLGQRDLVIDADGLVDGGAGQSLMNGFILRSAGGLLTGADYSHLGVFRVDTDYEISDQFFLSQKMARLHNLGAVLGPGLGFAQLQADLTMTYTADGHPGIHTAGIIEATIGDASLDGCVDDDDLSLLLSNWGAVTDWARGEFSGVPPVNDDDLSLLLSNWTGSACAATGPLVPEPATLALLALGSLAVIRRRRR